MARDFHLSVSADFIGHVKTRKLVRLLGGDESAPLRLIQFWSWAAEFAPNGDLSSIDIPEIEFGAGHRGLDGEMFKALVKAGFIDETPSGPQIHNWMLPGRTGFALEAMEKSRARWRRSKGIKTRNDEEVTEDSARNTAGVYEDSAVLHGSRFTVHGSPENLPPLRAIPAVAPLTGPGVTQMFGRIRSEEYGGIEWQGAGPVKAENASRAADLINATVGGAATVSESLRRFWRDVKTGEHPAAQEIAARGLAFAFACWAGQYPTDHEDITGVSPPKPPARSDRATGPPRDVTHGHARAEDSKHTRTGEVKL